MFEDYRKAYDELQDNESVNVLRGEIDLLVEKHDAKLFKLQKLLAEVEMPYRSRMAGAEGEIKKAVLKQGASVTLHNVQAKFAKGRMSTSWKKVAVEVNASQDVIGKHTSYGKPSVSVSVV